MVIPVVTLYPYKNRAVSCQYALSDGEPVRAFSDTDSPDGMQAVGSPTLL